MEKSLIPIEDLLTEVKLTIEELIVRKNASIETDLQVPKVFCAKKELRSVLYNLVSNAVKYSSPDRQPKVIVSTYSQGNCTVISVKDNGLGIPRDKLESVFAKFERVHTHEEGTGIGMFTVKRIVENMGGRIDLISILGAGSEFLVFIPNK